jgi:hypothetical protein
MGHDTYLYRLNKLDEQAYLRRSAGSQDSDIIYRLLDCEFANNGCSGDGSYMVIHWIDIKDAINNKLEKAIKYKNDDIYNFLVKLKELAQKDGQVLVHFG